MKKPYFLSFYLFLITSLSFGQIINEFEPNPAGTDPENVNFEIKGTPSEAFSGWILSIESDPETSQGTVDRATQVSGTFDSNGLLVVSIPDLENPSFTIVLVSNFTGDTNTDIDTNNDGTADDTSTFGTIYDAIAIPDTTGEALYGTQLGGLDFVYTGDEPQLVFRDGSTDDWFAINDPDNGEVYDINGVEIMGLGTTFNSETNSNTFSAINPIATIPTASTIKTSEIDLYKIVPNPTSLGYVNVSAKSTSKMNIAVFDLLGKHVLKQVVTDNKLYTSALKAGVYIIKVTQDGVTSTQKLVIN